MRPPLHTACLLGNEEDVLQLLALGVNIAEVDFVSDALNKQTN